MQVAAQNNPGWNLPLVMRSIANTCSPGVRVVLRDVHDYPLNGAIVHFLLGGPAYVERTTFAEWKVV
jgi:hypothetical protein